MSVTDAQFRIGVVGGGVILAATIFMVRFCGTPPLPPKPAAPSAASNTSQFASPIVYQDYVAKDAALAGVPAPTLDEMSRKLVFRVDESRHVLELGQPPLEIAGLSLAARKVEKALVLEIKNVTGSPLAYTVTATPAPNSSACSKARPIALNGMVIPAGESFQRVECVWSKDIALVVSRAETAELLPLQAWYLSMVPPTQLGLSEQIGRAHTPPSKAQMCSAVTAQSVRAGLERGQIAWRDLIDFYARHRCATYQFQSSYRAFTKDGERPIPAVAPGR